MSHPGGGPQGRAPHLDAALTELQHLAGVKGSQRQHRPVGAGQSGEIGPDHTVEYMVTQRGHRGGQAIDLDRRPAGTVPHHAVGQQGHAQHMVEVRVTEHDMVYARQRVEAEISQTGAGVDQQIVVEQESGGAAAGGDAARTAQNTDLHGFGGLWSRQLRAPWAWPQTNWTMVQR